MMVEIEKNISNVAITTIIRRKRVEDTEWEELEDSSCYLLMLLLLLLSCVQRKKSEGER